MSEFKYTPGPWKHTGEPGDGKRQFVESDQNKDNWNCLRCEVDSDDCNYDMAVANARLIAAAPELLEELKNALYYLTDNDPTMWAHPDSPYYSIHAAIVKAVGQPPSSPN